MPSIDILYFFRVGVFLLALTSLIFTAVWLGLKHSRLHQEIDLQDGLRINGSFGLLMASMISICLGDWPWFARLFLYA